MKEEIITLETAKLAKKKGFNLYSPAWYGCDDPSGDFEPNRLFCRSYSTWDDLGTEDDQEGTEIYSAPTQNLLQKWLRDEHYIDIFVIDSIKEECYDWEIRIADVKKKIQCDQYYHNYEAALEDALLKALKKIKIVSKDTCEPTPLKWLIK